MAHGRAEGARSSYEILRDRVAACGRVLDLGCGRAAPSAHSARPGGGRGSEAAPPSRAGRR
ncbi:hypothetical protein [Streptomyces decoyicus]|uniref:hypothetical protein n=1 Tax=Streptomyces decoyicus TaxID=249567 RepID=UPI001ADEFEF6|nr:hypothetical protein [Streptomyces decoyicus]QZY17485.1 hypothetical protein K7C20_21410 [Streptomyces decoyicus]